MAVQVGQLETVSPPGYARAYATTTVQVVRQGVLRPAAFAQWEALSPGTDGQYLGPLYGDPYNEVVMTFPQRTDERGLIQIWAPEPVRIELRVSVYGYPPVKQVIDLQFTEDPGDTALDALAEHAADPLDPHAAAGYITLEEAESTFLTAATGDELFLTQDEADARYAQAAISGMSQDAADLRYVNLSGDTMTGVLKLAWPAGASPLQIENPDALAPLTVSFTRADKTRWQIGIIQGAESGGNVGSDFLIGRHDDSGNWIDQAVAIRRSDGFVSLPGGAGFQVAGPVYFGNGVSTAQRVHQEGAVLVWRRNSDSAGIMTLDNSGNLSAYGNLSVGSGYIVAAGGNPLTLSTPGSIVIQPSSAYIHPYANNAVYLGHPGLRWANTYTTNLDAAGDLFAAGTITSNLVKSNGGIVQAGNDAGFWAQLKYDGLTINTGGADYIFNMLNGFGYKFRMAGTNFLVVENGPEGFYSEVATLVVSFGRAANRWWKIYCGQVDQSCTQDVKEDITDLDPQDVLDDLLKTPVVSFKYRQGGAGEVPSGLEQPAPEPDQVGIIAERTPSRFLLSPKSASPMSLAAAGVAGVQALQAQIDALRAEVSALKSAA